MLAEAGFAVFIADFYGEIPADFPAANPLAAALREDTDHYRTRLAAGVAVLRSVMPLARLSAIGFCMGGQAVLELARAGEDLALVASFHGLLTTDRKADPAAAHKPRALILHGDADPLAPRSDVIALWDELDAAGYAWHFHSYSGTRHGFTDPESNSRGLDMVRYNPSADRQAWAALMNTLDEIYG
jgi:dienelactone hydrolase